MISFLRWTGRVLFILGVLGLLACGGVLWKFTDWRKQKLAALDAGSRIAETAKGPVEYAEAGSGPAVLVFHGAPGGYDQALLIGQSLADSGYRIIAPSLPGFLRTPLTTGLFFDEQADAMAALLDTLGVEEAAVIGFSTGGQVALEFALRHPERTRGLVLVSPITKTYKPISERDGPVMLSEATLEATTGDMGAWWIVELANRSPDKVVDGVISMDTTLPDSQQAKLARYVLDDPGQLAFLRGLADSLAPISPREVGTRSDIAILRGLQPSNFDRIAAPTLAIFGTADSSGAWSDEGDVREWLPDAKIVEVDGAGHLVWFGPNAAVMKEAVADFLGELPTNAPPPDEALPE